MQNEGAKALKPNDYFECVTSIQDRDWARIDRLPSLSCFLESIDQAINNMT